MSMVLCTQQNVRDVHRPRYAMGACASKDVTAALERNTNAIESLKKQISALSSTRYEHEGQRQEDELSRVTEGSRTGAHDDSFRRRTTNEVIDIAEDCDVFISLHVDTGAAIARRLQDALNAKGISSWSCLQLEAGSHYRKMIVKQATRCRAFVPLISAAWCESRECEWEFNLIQRQSITKGSPLILPVFVEKLSPDDHWIVMALMSHQQVLFLDLKREAEVFGDVAKLVKKLRPTANEHEKDNKSTANEPKWVAGSAHGIEDEKARVRTLTHLSGTWRGYFFTKGQTQTANAAASKPSIESVPTVDGTAFEVNLKFETSNPDGSGVIVGEGYGKDYSGAGLFVIRDCTLTPSDETEGMFVLKAVKEYGGNFKLDKELLDKSSEEGVAVFTGVAHWEMKLLRDGPAPSATGTWSLPPPNEAFKGFVTMMQQVGDADGR